MAEIRVTYLSPEARLIFNRNTEATSRREQGKLDRKGVKYYTDRIRHNTKPFFVRWKDNDFDEHTYEIFKSHGWPIPPETATGVLVLG